MNSNFRADLHCHSTCSDGTASPQELIELAQKKGLNGLSITDHDTVAAYTQLALDKQPIQLITGIEFSSYENNYSVHILGYAFSPTAPSILALCSRHRERRTGRNQAILRLLSQAGFPLEEEELHTAVTDRATKTIGRPHIALAMVKRGYVANVPEAFRLYIGDGKSCFDPGETISVQETLDAIHNANGFAILAHPHLISPTSLVIELLKRPFDGIEGYYGTIQNNSQHHRWILAAEKKGWFITGGSDFHGDIKPNIALGASWTGEKLFRIFEARLQENLARDNEDNTL